MVPTGKEQELMNSIKSNSCCFTLKSYNYINNPALSGKSFSLSLQLSVLQHDYCKCSMKCQFYNSKWMFVLPDL